MCEYSMISISPVFHYCCPPDCPFCALRWVACLQGQIQEVRYLQEETLDTSPTKKAAGPFTT